MSNYVLDTHTIIWFLVNDQRLSNTAKSIILQSKKAASFFIPTIVLGEIVSVLEKGKIKGDLKELINSIKADPRFVIVPFDEFVFDKFVEENKNLEMHDRIIVATAKLFKARLVTKDEKIHQYYPKTIW